MAGQVQKQPPSQKVWGAKAPASEKEKKVERKIGTFERVEKKKEKPKTAAAGGGANPPKNPPKGPTGPKDPNKGESIKKYPNDEGKNIGGLSKGKKGTEKPENPFNKKQQDNKKEQSHPKKGKIEDSGYLVKKNSSDNKQPKKK